MMLIDRVLLVQVHLEELVVPLTSIILVPLGNTCQHLPLWVSLLHIEGKGDIRVELLKVCPDQVVLDNLDELARILDKGKVSLALKRTVVDLANELHHVWRTEGLEIGDFAAALGWGVFREAGPLHEGGELLLVLEVLRAEALDGGTAKERRHGIGGTGVPCCNTGPMSMRGEGVGHLNMVVFFAFYAFRMDLNSRSGNPARMPAARIPPEPCMRFIGPCRCPSRARPHPWLAYFEAYHFRNQSWTIRPASSELSQIAVNLGVARFCGAGGYKPVSPSFILSLLFFLFSPRTALVL